MVVLSIAGHGAQEPERVKGSQPDGLDDVFLLPGFSTTPVGSQQRILGKEFHHFIKQLEFAARKVVFVADSCHGGGLARSSIRVPSEMSFRQVAGYRLPVDLLQPVTAKSEEFMTEIDFDRTAFLAAVDRKTKAPEVRIPGIEGCAARSAMRSRARSKGHADADYDGKITVKELFTHVRQVVHQLSEQRQSIVTIASPGRDIERDVAFRLTRGSPTGRHDRECAAQEPDDCVGTRCRNELRPRRIPTSRRPVGAQRPVRLASLDGQSAHFGGLVHREAPFEIVQPVDYPDIIWDPKSHDVLAWGDVIAYRVDKSALCRA